MPGLRDAWVAQGSNSARQVLLAAEPGERADALAAMLGDEGYQVVVVGDGFELLNAWTFAWLASRAQPFGVIVTDGPMPLLSAPEAILELRQFSDCRAACIAAVGGPDQDPMDPDEILSQVRTAFSRESRRKKRACA
jgi:CheY-like chemotaxis protein